MSQPSGVPILARKTINKMGGVLNESVADTSMDFGRKMLAKFGWSEGKGLGKNMDGMKSHIKVKQRAESLGLGAQDEATLNAVAYAPPPDVQSVPRKKRGRAEEASDNSGSDSDSSSEDEQEAKVRQQLSGSGVLPGMSDEHLFKLCGGARLGMRARASQSGKQQRMLDADAAYLAKFGGGKAVAIPPPTPAVSKPTPAEAPDSKPPMPPGKRQKAHNEKAEKKSSKGAKKAEDKAAKKAEAKKAERKAAKKAERKAARKAERKAAA